MVLARSDFPFIGEGEHSRHFQSLVMRHDCIKISCKLNKILTKRPYHNVQNSWNFSCLERWLKLFGIKCPHCQSDAVYRYGTISTGKRRYLCLLCNRQFVNDSSWKDVDRRPICPNCGKLMHVYMREADYIRFRCSHYPACRTFIKLPKEADKPK